MTLATLVCAAAILATPPSGRPPIGPLDRVEPRVYDFQFQVTLSTLNQRNAGMRRQYHLVDAPIVMPVILHGTYSAVDTDSLKSELWLGSRQDMDINERSRLEDGLPHHTHLAIMPVASFQGQSLRWQLSYRVQVWSSRIDDAAAASITWPREWPAEVADGLKPQMYIESDDPLFAQTVERVSEGQLRMVPPYLAAKDLVRYCIEQVQVSGDGLNYGAMNVLFGMEVDGARFAANNRRGGPHDLVCICVAMLRAAGIPARPVIGFEENEKGRKIFVSWAEFYLPDAGWIPFDPVEMRGKGIRHLDVHQPWPEFGTMKDLHDRIPLAYHFIPPKSVESPQNPAVWGWDPQPGGDPGTQQQIAFKTISRGRGQEDPQ